MDIFTGKGRIDTAPQPNHEQKAQMEIRREQLKNHLEAAEYLEQLVLHEQDKLKSGPDTQVELDGVSGNDEDLILSYRKHAADEGLVRHSYLNLSQDNPTAAALLKERWNANDLLDINQGGLREKQLDEKTYQLLRNGSYEGTMFALESLKDYKERIGTYINWEGRHSDGV